MASLHCVCVCVAAAIIIVTTTNHCCALVPLQPRFCSFIVDLFIVVVFVTAKEQCVCCKLFFHTFSTTPWLDLPDDDDDWLNSLATWVNQSIVFQLYRETRSIVVKKSGKYLTFLYRSNSRTQREEQQLPSVSFNLCATTVCFRCGNQWENLPKAEGIHDEPSHSFNVTSPYSTF